MGTGRVGVGVEYAKAAPPSANDGPQHVRSDMPKAAAQSSAWRARKKSTKARKGAGTWRRPG